MDRGRLRALSTRRDALHDRLCLRPRRGGLRESRLRSPQRRAITLSFGSGPAIRCAPVAVLILLAGLIAFSAPPRAPVPVATILIANPAATMPDGWRIELSWQ